VAELPVSERRRSEARARGEVAVSPLATGAAALFGGGLALFITARGAGARLASFAEQAFSGRLESAGAFGHLLGLVARLVLPVALSAFGAALLAGLAQSRGLFTLGAFGVRRRDPDEALPLMPWGLALALAMAAALAARPLAAALARADGMRAATAAALSALSSLAPRVLALLTAGGLADLALRMVRLDRSLGMSRAEQDRELREEEGDPQLKAEQRRRQRAP
jgi:flagellar biosynthesis protein FlhB